MMYNLACHKFVPSFAGIYRTRRDSLGTLVGDGTVDWTTATGRMTAQTTLGESVHNGIGLMSDHCQN